MTDPNAPVEIDTADLAAHQQRLMAISDRTRAAYDAAHAPVGHDAFGGYGHFMALECAKAAAEGVETLRAAHEGAETHCQKVEVWVRDLDATEGEIAALFSTAPEMRGA